MKKIFYIVIVAFLCVAFTITLEAKETDLKQLENDFFNLVSTFNTIAQGAQNETDFTDAERFYNISIAAFNRINSYDLFIFIRGEMKCETDKKTLQKVLNSEIEVLKSLGKTRLNSDIKTITTMLSRIKNQNLIFNGNKLIDKIREWIKIIDEL